MDQLVLEGPADPESLVYLEGLVLRLHPQDLGVLEDLLDLEALGDLLDLGGLLVREFLQTCCLWSAE